MKMCVIMSTVCNQVTWDIIAHVQTRRKHHGRILPWGSGRIYAQQNLTPSPIATLSSVSVDMSQRVRVAGEGQCGSSGVSFCRLRRTFGIRGGGHGSVTEGNPLGPRPCKDGELAGGAKKLPFPGDATTSGVSNSCVVSIPDGRGVGGEVLEMLPQPDRPKRSSCCVFPRKDSRANAYILPRLDFV